MLMDYCAATLLAANFVWLTSPEVSAFNKRSFSDRFGIY